LKKFVRKKKLKKFKDGQVVYKQYRNGRAVTIQFEIETSDEQPTNTYVVKSEYGKFSECPGYLLGEKKFEKNEDPFCSCASK
jgi:hypothetical protein